VFIKVCSGPEQSVLIQVLFAFRNKIVRELMVLLKLCDERFPHAGGRLARCEALGIAYDDNTISGSREEDIEALSTPHKPDVISTVESR
jgi:hypothetical protein